MPLLQFCLNDQWLWAMLVLALPLTCKDFSGLSRNLMRLWIGDGNIPKFLATVCLKTLFFKYLSRRFFHKVVSLVPSLHGTIWASRDALFILIHNTLNLFTCGKCSKEVIFGHSTFYPVFYPTLSQFGWHMLLVSNSEQANIYKIINLHMKYLVFVLHWHFTQHPKMFLNSIGCIIMGYISKYGRKCQNIPSINCLIRLNLYVCLCCSCFEMWKDVWVKAEEVDLLQVLNQNLLCMGKPI